MSRPICVSCKVEMRCKKNGVTVAGEIKHYHRSGDMYNCPECGHEIIIGLNKGYNSNMPADIYIEE